jgi:hypothetical protein
VETAAAAANEDQPEPGPNEIQLRVTIGDETIGLGDVTVQVYSIQTYMHSCKHTLAVYALFEHVQ